MTARIHFFILITLLTFAACQKDNFDDREIVIPNFNFPKTHVFEGQLSAYNIFEGAPNNLVPTNDFEELELSASLFSDYAHKQRLIQVPDGRQITKLSDNTISFPNGTILTKTFYYYLDERDPSLGKNIIETRLLIKENDQWNAATYVWNELQTEASLELNGTSKQVSWKNLQGTDRTTLYQIPTENECMTCHQTNSTMTPLGPTLLNLNKSVSRNGVNINQLDHLQAIGILNSFAIDPIPTMADYNDLNASISERGRAYLAMNCAHCHQPNAWDIPADKDFDFRYATSLTESGIEFGKDRISRNIINQQMPFIGTTMMDEEGVALLLEYLERL